MEQSIHTKSKGGLQKSKDKSKTSEKIALQSAIYLKDFEILLYFTNGEQGIVNFLPLFSKLSGAFANFGLPANSKKYFVKNGNIYWGRNEDVIFPLASLYTGVFSKKPKEEILYII